MGAKVRLLVMISGSRSALFRNSEVGKVFGVQIGGGCGGWWQ